MKIPSNNNTMIINESTYNNETVTYPFKGTETDFDFAQFEKLTTYVSRGAITSDRIKDPEDDILLRERELKPILPWCKPIPCCPRNIFETIIKKEKVCPEYDEQWEMPRTTVCIKKCEYELTKSK